METALAILMVLGIFVGIPVLIGLVLVGMFIWGDRQPRRAERAKALEAAAEALRGEAAETHGEAVAKEPTKEKEHIPVA